MPIIFKDVIVYIFGYTSMANFNKENSYLPQHGMNYVLSYTYRMC